MSKIVAYRRVSTTEQNTERQIYDTGINFDLEFEDKMSGKDNRNRKGFQECLQSLCKGDTLYVHDISRAGRNTEQVLTFIRELNERGVNVKFYKEGLEFGGEGCDPFKAAISQMVLTVLAACHTLFLTNHSSAVKEGLSRAKARGVKLGAANENWKKSAKTKVVTHNKRVNTKAREWAEQYRTHITLWNNEGMSLDRIATNMKQMNLKTSTGKFYTAGSVRNLFKYLEIER